MYLIVKRAMILNSETIIYFYTHKSKQILCQIKANTKNGNFKTTCRCLSEDQWVTFDNKLEKILMEKEFWKDEKWIKFSIDPAIEIKIKKSKLSLNHFGSWLDVNINCNKHEKGVLESNLVLECLIDFKLAINILPDLQGSYEPQMEAASNETVPYEPYTPSKNTFQTDNGKVIKNSLKNVYVSNEDTYTPKPLITISTVDSISTNLIPKYIPAPINSKRRSKERYKCSQSNIRNEIEKDKSLGTKLNKNWKARENEYVPKCEEVTKINVPIYIPTPIEQTKLLKISKEDNIRKNKKRSNTIDVFPEQFDENNKKKQISEIEEPNNKEIESHCYNKMLKKRHLTIDEIPTALSNACVNNPISVAEKMHQNILKTCNRSKNVKGFDIEQLDTDIKQIYTTKKEEINNNEKLEYGKNKNLNKCFASIEQVKTLLDEEFKNKIKLHKSVEKKIDSNEKSSEDKFVVDSKWPLKMVLTGSDKTEESKEMISGLFDSIAQHNEIKSNNTVNVRSRMNKSLRRSDRSSSKPKRLVEEQPNSFSSNKNKSKKYNYSHKNKELFGTDDEDNDIDGFDNNNKIYATAYETPLMERSYKFNLPSTSAKLNRIKDKISESCQGKDDVKKPSSKI